MPRTLRRSDEDPTLRAENGANRPEEVFDMVATILAVLLLFPVLLHAGVPVFRIPGSVGAWLLLGGRDDRGRR